jgi:hypothetical protein
MKRVPLLFVAPLLIWGCSDIATDPDLDAVYDFTGPSSIADSRTDGPEGIVQSVTGGAQLHVPSSGVWRTFSVNAVKASDGTVRGTVEWRAHQGKTGSKVKGNVVCLSVAGNEAWLAVIFQKAENPANLGKWASIRAVDNGEGVNSSPDEVGIRWRGFPREENDPNDFCVGQPTDLGTSPVEAGNLQIRG